MRFSLYKVFTIYLSSHSLPTVPSGSKWQQTYTVHWRLFSAFSNMKAQSERSENLHILDILRKSHCGSSI